MSPLDCWYLTGPTAAGKTAVGIELARRIDAEIISLDSMAVYRRLDLGTAKPTAAERSQAVHHLLDLVEPTEHFSVADYRERALEKIAEINARGRAVLFVGGTPLYLKALIRGLFEGPAADWNLRADLERKAQNTAEGELHRELTSVDPAAAARIHPNDTRRLVRALEIFHSTGTRITQLQQQSAPRRTAMQCRIFALAWPRDELARRIDRRVEAMFEAGLVEETRAVLARCGALGRTAGKALGYREVLDYLAGRGTLAETIALVQLRTRQFAKRQMTWFRGLDEVRLLPVGEPFDPAAVAKEIALAPVEPPPTASLRSDADETRPPAQAG